MTAYFLTDKWRPQWSRPTHPIVRQYLRKPLATLRLGYFVAFSALGLLLAFGSFSLPMLYFLCSLVVLLQIATSTGEKIHAARTGYTWDLMRATPLTLREVLLSLWAASIWQLRGTWIMFLYRLMHGIVIIGVIVLAFMLGDIPLPQWILVLAGGTLVIMVQPLADMYYSGMAGLLSAGVTRDRAAAQGLAVCGVVLYWLLWLGLTALVLLVSPGRISLEQIVLVLAIPVVLPISLGYACFQLAMRLNQG